MMRQILRQTSKLCALLGDLIVSGAGCFIFTSGFRQVAMEEEESDTKPPMPVGASSPGRLAGLAAAIFLLLFVTSEAVAAVVALQR